MKSLKMIIAAAVLGSVSFGSMAATLLTKEDLDKNPGKYEKIGTVTTTAKPNFKNTFVALEQARFAADAGDERVRRQ
ncbi:hypothetical protein ISX56_30160 [Serratia ureilytica]|nr:hypothetical protein [Serratia ureilytica]